jgi:hypothetical protein
MKHRFTGTYVSNPFVTHRVETADDLSGYGIYGYYASEFAAHSVARDLKRAGRPIANVVAHDPDNMGFEGVHPLIEQHGIF